MDPFGHIVRELLRQQRDVILRNARGLAEECRKDGMKNPDIEEILCANGFESDVIAEVLKGLSSGQK